MGRIQRHIMRRVIGSSDCPLIEKNVAGESLNNSAKLKLALETYGYLDAGPFGAAYDLAFTAPNMLTTPVVAIEGNGSQEFHGIEAYFNNSPLITIAAGPGGVPPAVLGGTNTQYSPGAVMFSFEGEAPQNGTPDVHFNWGGDAYLRGIKIIGPVLTTGVGYWNNVITARFIDHLFVEDCEMYGWTFGAMIAATAVRHGGSLSHNWLHDMICVHTRPNQPSPTSPWTTQAWGIILDDNKPHDGTTVVQGAGSVTLPNYVAWSNDFLMEENRITDLIDNGTLRETDGINIQIWSSSHRISGGIISNVGEAIDCFGSYLNIHGVRIDNVQTGLKLINGFSGSNISNVNISNVEMWGIYMQGSGRTAVPSENNVISGCTVSRVNLAAVSQPASCMTVGYTPGFTDKGPVQRLIVHDNIFDPAGLATPLSIRGEGDHQHFINNMEILRGSALPSSFAYIATNSSHSSLNAVASDNYMTSFLTADLNNKTGNNEYYQVGGWTKILDTANEFDAVTGLYTINREGSYHISFQLTFKGVIAAISQLRVIVHCSQTSAGARDWFFTGDPNTIVGGEVTVTGSVDDIFTSSRPGSVCLLVNAIGDAASGVGLKGPVGPSGGSHFCNFSVIKI